MKDLAKAIYHILTIAGKLLTILRNTILNIVFLCFVILIVIALVFDEEKIIEQDSSLLLSITGDIVEEKQLTDPFGEFLDNSLGFSTLPQETLLQDIIDAIDTAADDQRIGSIVLDMSRMGSSSLNQLQDIGESLQRFKDSGKQVIAAEDFYSQQKYYLATFADFIFLNPMGLVDLHGFASYRLFFKDAIEKLKINYHVFRVGTYKSALEPLTRNTMSEEAKQQNREWLNSVWKQYSSEIIERRNLQEHIFDQYTNDISTLLRESEGDTANLAVETGLVDELKTRYELNVFLAQLSGGGEKSKFRHIPFKEYLKQITRSYSQPKEKNSIGIIIAQGNILTGEQPPGTIGSETLIKRIRKAKEGKHIKALVLRIDTGGGSVVASEIIRRELLNYKETGKTLVVSMASMAASGGYWISANADEIWAHPTTLTGSIGIFGAIPTFEDSLAHLGIYSDGVGTTNLSSGLNLTQPLSDELKSAIQLNIENGYQRFLDIVSTGRGITKEKTMKLAEGRVFDGRTAQKLGLVDKLGNLENAIAAAAALEGLDDYAVQYIQKDLTLTEMLLENLQQNVQTLLPDLKMPATIRTSLRAIQKATADIPLFQDPKGMYAHCLIQYM